MRLQSREECCYTIDHLYAIISDVEQYHSFVPWCDKSVIIEEEQGGDLLVDLHAKFGFMYEKYRSRVRCYPPRYSGNSNAGEAVSHDIEEQLAAIGADVRYCAVQSTLVSGPFKRLNSVWFMHEKSQEFGVSVVYFLLDVEFMNKVFKSMAKVYFNTAYRRIKKSFYDRAQLLYDADKAADKVVT